MNHLPRISVLLPVFNAAPTLPACLRSISRQTETRFECLILDDGSTDASIQIALAWCQSDARFRLLKLERHGIIPALLVGLEEARAPYLARMDSDDLMVVQRLAIQLQRIEAPDSPAMVGCHVRIFPRRPLSEGRKAYETWLNSLRSPEDIARDRFIECPIAHPTWLVRRDVLERYPYRPVEWPEDYDIILRLLAANQRLVNCPKILHLWRDHPSRLSRVDARYRLAAFMKARAAFLAQGPLGGQSEYILCGYGSTGRMLARALQLECRMPRYIVEVHAGRLGQKIMGAAVVAYSDIVNLPRLPILVSLSGERPRRNVRHYFAAIGMVEGEDYTICA